jgi:GNAT superfamily N-acetyltransferase
MQLEEITIRLANVQDLGELNRVVERAVMSWRLPDRVKRLALPTYLYNEHDMQHMEILVAVDPEKSLIGLAAWELFDYKDDPQQRSSILLHGIYVLPEHQRHGIGSHLLGMVEQTARAAGNSGILVKAQSDAVGFFRAKGYSQLATDDQAKDYPNRYWKSVN